MKGPLTETQLAAFLKDADGPLVLAFYTGGSVLVYSYGSPVMRAGLVEMLRVQCEKEMRGEIIGGSGLMPRPDE